MLANVQQATLHPIIEKTVAKGSSVYTDEYSIYARLPGLGYSHRPSVMVEANTPGTRTVMASGMSRLMLQI